jgi:Flp pilus assembly protein TadG
MTLRGMRHTRAGAASLSVSSLSFHETVSELAMVRIKRDNERGAAAVEFAILLPLLVMLLFGIIEFSILFNRQQGLHAAAREGARYASLPTNTKDEIEDRVRDSLVGVLNDADRVAASITVTPNATRPCDIVPAGTAVVVTVEVEDQIDVPLFDGGVVDLTGRGEFRCE